MLTFRFHDKRPSIVDIWRDVFAGWDFATVSPTEKRSATREGEARLMLSALAHETFGGRPVIGRSQVLKNTLEGKHSPAWIVTTVPMPAVLRRVTDESGKKSFKITPKLEISSKDEAYLVTMGITRAIDDFNSINKQIINLIDVDITTMLSQDTEAKREAEGIFEALYFYNTYVTPGSGRAMDRRLAPAVAFSSGQASQRSTESAAGDFGLQSKLREYYFSNSVKASIGTFGLSKGVLIDAISDARNWSENFYSQSADRIEAVIVFTQLNRPDRRFALTCLVQVSRARVYLQNLKVL